MMDTSENTTSSSENGEIFVTDDVDDEDSWVEMIISQNAPADDNAFVAVAEDFARIEDVVLNEIAGHDAEDLVNAMNDIAGGDAGDLVNVINEDAVADAEDLVINVTNNSIDNDNVETNRMMNRR